MRTYYTNKTSRDLLQWMGDSTLFTKLKLNQIIMHTVTLILELTDYSSVGEGQDERFGLHINEACYAKHPLQKSAFEIVISFLLVRHVIEEIIYLLA